MRNMARKNKTGTSTHPVRTLPFLIGLASISMVVSPRKRLLVSSPASLCFEQFARVPSELTIAHSRRISSLYVRHHRLALPLARFGERPLSKEERRGLLAALDRRDPTEGVRE